MSMQPDFAVPSPAAPGVARAIVPTLPPAWMTRWLDSYLAAAGADAAAAARAREALAATGDEGLDAPGLLRLADAALASAGAAPTAPPVPLARADDMPKADLSSFWSRRVRRRAAERASALTPVWAGLAVVVTGAAAYVL